MNLEQISYADFERCLKDTFQLHVHSQAVCEVVLTSVTRYGTQNANASTTGNNESFSAIFHAQSGRSLPQCIYQLSHPRLGELDVFLVPLGPDRQGMQLEAVFNRMNSICA